MKAKQILTKQALHKLFEKVQGEFSLRSNTKMAKSNITVKMSRQFKIRFNDDNILDLF